MISQIYSTEVAILRRLLEPENADLPPEAARFILALIRQESVFKPLAKSPAGARGLLQLTMDAAQKYGPGAGLNALRENQLYQPETSITLGAEYIEHLATLFPGVAFGSNYFVTVEQTASEPFGTVPQGCDLGCPAFLAYGSVLDNVSGDATTLEAQYLKELQTGCERNHCDYVLMNTGRPLAEALTEYLARRLRVRIR